MEKNTKELKILGPEADDELVEYFLWLPYRKIKNEENYKLAYLDFIQTGMIKVLEKYEFNLKKVNGAFNKVREKLMDNISL